MSALTFVPITPKPLNAKAMEDAMLKELGVIGEAIRRDFEKTTKSWKRKPPFEVLVESGPPATVLVATDDKIYDYVDRGTEAHVILPKKAKALRFQSGYKAKTTPGVIGSSAGGPFGATVFSKGVIHPGTKARGFSKEIAKKWQPKFKTRMQARMNQVAKASGHAL
ncbi:MAG: hypothetical protein GY832_25920 [Chloroflexi bacterium]|nr:hypothetical protein [Chloroflexota bacterium]